MATDSHNEIMCSRNVKMMKNDFPNDTFKERKTLGCYYIAIFYVGGHCPVIDLAEDQTNRVRTNHVRER